MNKQFTFWGIAALGAAFVIGGLLVIWLGLHSRGELQQSLVDEKITGEDPAILLTYEGGRAPEGVEVPEVLIDTSGEAHNQAMLIRMHTLAVTGGKTYTEMDREDPARATYITSLTLQNSLHIAHIGLELSLFVIGTGFAFVGLGAGTLVLGLPLVRKVIALK
ncbi:MAG TPA: hypothetical protein VJ182_01560 [Anaerolineales bacterium]|nr:hypothetical protein [Anaerolineales bacterium]